MSQTPSYLDPYQRAAQRHGAKFPTLLWASPATQAARFDAMMRLLDFSARSILDVGCGRGDLADFLIDRRIRWKSYRGIEGVPQLAEAARRKRHPAYEIVEADFVAQPELLGAGVDVVLFSGSLNTIHPKQFYGVLERAFEAAGEFVLFNFLCSPDLAAADYLHWHRVETVIQFAQGLSSRVRKLEDYLAGDCTVAIAK